MLKDKTPAIEIEQGLLSTIFESKVEYEWGQKVFVFLLIEKTVNFQHTSGLYNVEEDLQL